MKLAEIGGPIASHKIKSINMEKFEWISKQNLETLKTPHPHSNRQELENALEESANALVDASSVVDLLMGARQQKQSRVSREDQQDARFQIYHKYRAWGYNSPQEMMAGEPDIVAFMNGQGHRSDTVGAGEMLAKAMRFARAIIDLQHQLREEKGSKFCTHRLDGLNRKVVHELVSTNNKICSPMLPNLKTESVDRRSGKAVIEISQQ